MLPKKPEKIKVYVSEVISKKNIWKMTNNFFILFRIGLVGLNLLKILDVEIFLDKLILDTRSKLFDKFLDWVLKAMKALLCPVFRLNCQRNHFARFFASSMVPRDLECPLETLVHHISSVLYRGV